MKEDVESKRKGNTINFQLNGKTRKGKRVKEDVESSRVTVG